MSAHSAKFRLVLSMVIYGTIGLFVRSISLPTSLIANFRGAVGAIFLLLVDNLSRNLLATEIPLGILTSLIGAPFFIYLITRDGERN